MSALAAGPGTACNSLRCALINCNGLFDGHGALHPGFYAFTEVLERRGVDVAFIPEPHLPSGAALPSDQPYGIYPALSAFSNSSGRRDAALMFNSRSGLDHSPLLYNSLQNRDIAARLIHHGPNDPPTLVCSAYAPDTSRGLEERAEFWSRLDAVLQVWRDRHPSADVVLALDSNTWLRQLDSARAQSRGAHFLVELLNHHGLVVHNPPDVPTHISGTVIDLVATSTGVRVENVVVHSDAAHADCQRPFSCWPLLTTDHMLITFDVIKELHRSASPSPWRFGPVDWRAAIMSDAEGLSRWHQCVLDARELDSPEAHQTAADSLMVILLDWLWTLGCQHGPVTCSSKIPRRLRRRWWSGECQQAWERRQTAYAGFRASPTSENRELYRMARNEFAHIVRRSRAASWEQFSQDMVSRAPRDPRGVARTIRREMQSRSHPPACMLDPRDGNITLGACASADGWARHFADVSRPNGASFDAGFHGRVSRRVRRLWARAAAHDDLDVDLVEADLIGARSQVNCGTSTGHDRIPYDVCCVDWGPWNCALLDFFNLLLRWGVVPDAWRHGIVVPLPKPGDPQTYGNWRPITLLPCFGKFFECLLLPRLRRRLDPQLSPCQSGFRYGADQPVWCLTEVLRMRRTLPARHRQTFVAFLDVRKAYDTVWRDGLLHKLWARGVQCSAWRVCASLLTSTSSRVRLQSGLSPAFSEAAGVRQGSILSPIEFLVFIDSLAHELSALPGVKLTCSRGAVGLSCLLYADDIAIVAESEDDMQRALEIAEQWAHRWRLSFGFGADKTAVMSFFGGSATGESPFRLAGTILQFVEEYRYLGVVLDRRLTFAAHSRMLQERALRTFFQCTAWAKRERLPLTVIEKLVSAYVIPACLYGTELMCCTPARMRELDACQRRIGRFLLHSSAAPNCVVLGDLGWRPWSSLVLQRAIGLVCRLASAPAGSLSQQVFSVAVDLPNTWCHSIAAAAVHHHIPLPRECGIAAGSDHAVRGRYMRNEVGPRLAAGDLASWRMGIASAADPALQLYATIVRTPLIAPVHNLQILPHYAAAWARLRSGSSWLSAHRVSRHVRGDATCTLCGSGNGDVWHALTTCPAVAQARASWLAVVGNRIPSTSREPMLQYFFAALHQPMYALAAHAAFAYAIETAFAGS